MARSLASSHLEIRRLRLGRRSMERSVTKNRAILFVSADAADTLPSTKTTVCGSYAEFRPLDPIMVIGNVGRSERPTTLAERRVQVPGSRLSRRSASRRQKCQQQAGTTYPDSQRHYPLIPKGSWEFAFKIGLILEREPALRNLPFRPTPVSYLHPHATQSDTPHLLAPQRLVILKMVGFRPLAQGI